MNNILIVSCVEKSTNYFIEFLKEESFDKIATTQSCSDARRMMLERDFDLILINSPLRDESAENFARDIAHKGASQVILVVKTERYEEVSPALESDGILTVAKPINKAILRMAIKLANATQNKLRKVYADNDKLKQKIEDIRIVDRAKCVLISYMNMDEKEAHRYIEKQAMDMRATKRIIAERILKTYEN